MNDVKKVPCVKCGVMILPKTAELYAGMCAPCNEGRGVFDIKNIQKFTTYLNITSCEEEVLIKYLPNEERIMYHTNACYINMITTDNCADAVKKQLEFCVTNMDSLHNISFYDGNNELGFPEVELIIEIDKFDTDVILTKEICNSLMKSGISISFKYYDN